MAYIGRGVDKISNIEVLDNITFTDSAGPYNLLKATVAFVPASHNNLVISIDGIIQSPDSYTLSGSTITFDSSMASTSVMNFIYQIGVGVITTPADGSVDTAQLASSAVTSTKIADEAVTGGKISPTFDVSAKTVTLPSTVLGLGTGLTNTQLQNNSISINGSSVALGGSVTGIGTETYPTFTSVTPSTITNDATTLTIAGDDFGASGIPMVEFQSSTGAITPADSIVRDSDEQLTVVATLPTDGTYYIRIELNSGLAVRSSSAVLTVSDAPEWTTSAGSLGSIAGDFSGTVATVAATGDTVTYAETTSVLTNASQANCSLNSSTGVITTTDFGGSSTTATTYNFTIRATDAQAQTADRAFSLTSTFSIEGGVQLN